MTSEETLKNIPSEKATINFLNVREHMHIQSVDLQSIYESLKISQ